MSEQTTLFDVGSQKATPEQKQKRNWENAFQRWIGKEWLDETTPYGMCGFGAICDFCKDMDKGRPCIRALNAMCRELKIVIDYSNRDFRLAWNGFNEY